MGRHSVEKDSVAGASSEHYSWTVAAVADGTSKGDRAASFPGTSISVSNRRTNVSVRFPERFNDTSDHAPADDAWVKIEKI